MLEKIEESRKLSEPVFSTLKSEISEDLYPIILKESQIAVKDLMNHQSANISQFCLFKIVRAVNIAGTLNR